MHQALSFEHQASGFVYWPLGARIENAIWKIRKFFLAISDNSVKAFFKYAENLKKSFVKLPGKFFGNFKKIYGKFRKLWKFFEIIKNL